MYKLKSLHFQQKEGFGLCSDPAINDDACALNTNDQKGFLNSADHLEERSSLELVKKAVKFCKNSREQNPRCKVFVGNISYKVKPKELKSFCEYFGIVIHAEIARDRIKKWSRGFGYVVFSNEQDAQKAINASDQERTLDGRVMAIKRLERKKKGKSGGINHKGEERESLQDAVQHFTEKPESECSVKFNGVISQEDASFNYYINRLNDDSILHVFKYLGLKDRIRVERVCKRWRKLVIDSWQSVHHLDFQGIFRSFSGSGGLTDDILWSILKRSSALKSLDLSASPSLLTELSVHLIGKYCKGLHKLDLSGVTVTTSSLRALSKQCSKLKTVRLKGCHKVGEKGLWWLFKQCKELKEIDVSANNRLSGQCFFMLTEACEQLDLHECAKVRDAALFQVGTRCSNLKSINISECTCITDEGLIGLTQNCRGLESLELSRMSFEVTSRGLKSVANLTHLRNLNLSRNKAVNDEVLFAIGSSCIHLSLLNISRCHGEITDAGLQCLASCYQLSDLCINQLEQITDESIKHLAVNGVMKKFVARECTSITDQAVIDLIRECPNLRELDVSGCDEITDSSLEYLHQCSTTLVHCPMELDIGGTSVTLNAAEAARTATTWCRVVTEDFSMKSIRGEREPRIEFGIMLPDWDEDDEEDEDKLQVESATQYGHAEDFLVAWDPSMYSDEEWDL